MYLFTWIIFNSLWFGGHGGGIGHGGGVGQGGQGVGRGDSKKGGETQTSRRKILQIQPY